jgi:hypothetical protein
MGFAAGCIAWTYYGTLLRLKAYESSHRKRLLALFPELNSVEVLSTTILYVYTYTS